TLRLPLTVTSQQGSLGSTRIKPAPAKLVPEFQLNPPLKLSAAPLATVKLPALLPLFRVKVPLCTLSAPKLPRTRFGMLTVVFTVRPSAGSNGSTRIEPAPV